MKKIETLEETLEKILTEYEVVSNNNVLFKKEVTDLIERNNQEETTKSISNYFCYSFIVAIIFIALFILLIVTSRYVYRLNENIIHTSLIIVAISVLNFIVCILFHFKIVVVAILFVSGLFLPSISYPMKNPELTRQIDTAINILAILLVVSSFILMCIQYYEYTESENRKKE